MVDFQRLCEQCNENVLDASENTTKNPTNKRLSTKSILGAARPGKKGATQILLTTFGLF
jgi:hypothetical protein